MRDLLVLWYNNKKHARSGDGCELMMAFEVENTADKFGCGGGIFARDGAGAQARGNENINWGPEKVELVIRNWSGPAAQPYLVFLSTHTHTHTGHMCLSLSSRGGGWEGGKCPAARCPSRCEGGGPVS